MNLEQYTSTVWRLSRDIFELVTKIPDQLDERERKDIVESIGFLARAAWAAKPDTGCRKEAAE